MFRATSSNSGGWTVVRAVVASALLATVGCESGQPKTYSIDGRLVYPDGSPVPNSVVVAFRTTIDGVEYVASGETREDGRFQLTTFTPEDGAVAGEHQVSASWVPLGEVITGPPAVDPKFESQETSGLTATVSPDGSNEIVLTVTAPAGRKSK